MLDDNLLDRHAATDILIVSGADVRQLLGMAECIALMKVTMQTVSRGGAQLPLRIGASLPGGNLLAVMPGYLEEPASAGAKVIAVCPGNAQQGLSSHMGVVVLFDPARGIPVAVIDAAAITALRTAAASAVATDVLARPDAGNLAIIGTGEQAVAHLHAMGKVRRLRQATVWGRSIEKARAFAQRESTALGLHIAVADTVEHAVADADIVCTTTGSREPILEGAWVRPGTHVNLVGASSAQAREANEGLVMKSAYFVDFKPSALAQSGDLLAATGTLAAKHIRGEIGEVLLGKVTGRRHDDEITIYKSLGIAAQDLAAAHLVYRKARQAGRGTPAVL